MCMHREKQESLSHFKPTSKQALYYGAVPYLFLMHTIIPGFFYYPQFANEKMS